MFSRVGQTFWVRGGDSSPLTFPPPGYGHVYHTLFEVSFYSILFLSRIENCEICHLILGSSDKCYLVKSELYSIATKSLKMPFLKLYCQNKFEFVVYLEMVIIISINLNNKMLFLKKLQEFRQTWNLFPLFPFEVESGMWDRSFETWLRNCIFNYTVLQTVYSNSEKSQSIKIPNFSWKTCLS